MLTPDQVLRCLTDTHCSNTELARLIGCSREAVRQVRYGLSHQSIHPELPRKQQRRRVNDACNCQRCQHWRNGCCDLGFPDPIEEGVAFAEECSVYSPRSQVMSAA